MMVQKHYLKEFPPIICPKCGGEAFLDAEMFRGYGYVISVKCEFCSNEEYIGSDDDFCSSCPNNIEPEHGS